MKYQLLQISKPVTNVFDNNKLNKKITSQCLFGELFEPKDIRNGWVFVKLLTDGYEGYIKNRDISKNMLKTNYIVSNIRTIVMSEPDHKSKLIVNLPICSQIYIENHKDGWARIKINKNRFGYVPEKHILNKNTLLNDWVKIAEKFINVPYRWGGRDSLGIDCSALVQLSSSFNRLKLPRDSYDQYKFFKKSDKFTIVNSIEKEELKRGDLIYWKGHISIVKNKNSIIHASGYHGSVVEEKIIDALTRIKLKPKYIINY